MVAKKNADTQMVKVRVDRLFQVVGALIEGGLAEAVVEKFKDHEVLVPLDQAVSFKSFVAKRVKSVAAASAGPGKLSTAAAKKIKTAMPLDFGHCT